MNWINFNYNLTNINNILNATNTALEGKLKGKKSSDILINFGSQLTTSTLGTQIAYDEKYRTGSNLGITINNMADYSTAKGRQSAMQGLMASSLFSDINSHHGCCRGGGFPGMMPMIDMSMLNSSYMDGSSLYGSMAPNFGTSVFNYNSFFS